MKKITKTKLGETKFTVGKTPYANEKASYSKDRADKKVKAIPFDKKLPEPDLKPFG